MRKISVALLPWGVVVLLMTEFCVRINRRAGIAIMISRQLGFAVVALLFVTPVGAQTPTLNSLQASAFIGTWTFAMSNPPGSHQTIRIWDNNGIVAASLQI